MNSLLRITLKILGCALDIIYLPYLFGKIYNAMIYSKLGSYYATHGILKNWIWGFVTTGIVLLVTLGIPRIFHYIKYGN